MIEFTKYFKFSFIIAIIISLASIFSVSYFGLNLGMDFQGGTSIRVEYEKTPKIEEIKSNLEIQNYQIQDFGQNGIVLKMNNKDISGEEYDRILNSLNVYDNRIIDSELQTISPVVGSELKQKTILVVIVSLISMLLYIAFAFKDVSRPVSSFQYGFVSTAMLFHDILIPLGLFSILGAYFNVQFTIPIVTALLAVIGYSINNNIVIFDRIRENLNLNPKLDYTEIVNKSLNQIFVRCIQITLTTLFVLFALYYFFTGEEGIRYFALAASTGIIVGTFSSIFLATPMLAKWVERRERKRA